MENRNFFSSINPRGRNGSKYFLVVFFSKLSPAVNRFCKTYSIYSQLKRVTDRQTDKQTDRRKSNLNSAAFTLAIAKSIVHWTNPDPRIFISISGTDIIPVFLALLQPSHNIFNLWRLTGRYRQLCQHCPSGCQPELLRGPCIYYKPSYCCTVGLRVYEHRLLVP